MSIKCVVAALASVVGLYGCGSVPETERSTVRQVAQRLGAVDASAAVNVASVTSASGLPGYEHTASRSRMVTGPGTSQQSVSGLTQLVGSYGTQSLNAANGFEMGTQNSDSPLLSRPPYGSSLDEHCAHVRAYFVNAGIPSSEVDTVRGLVGGGEIGPVGGTVTALPTRYYSTVTRSTGGIPVADSFAYARIDNSDEIVSEAVYWPAISATVVSQAVSLNNHLAATSDLNAFRSTLPQGPGHVVIRHSSAVVGGAFEAYALYDIAVSLGNGSAAVRHFDAAGREVRLPQERRTPATVASR